MEHTAELSKAEARANALRLAKEAIEKAVRNGHLECYVQSNSCSQYVRAELGKLGYEVVDSSPYTSFYVHWG